jgi:hypothetical protein
MRRVGVQGMHQRRSVQNQAYPRVAMTVNPPLVTLGQAKPALQLEMIPDRDFSLNTTRTAPGISRFALES